MNLNAIDTPSAPRRFALIGHGRIGAPVVQAWRDGALDGWTLAAVLVRQAPADAEPWMTTDIDAFLASAPDLIVEAAGPPALAAHAVAALAVADLWTVSAAALADAELTARIMRQARLHGHRLRVLAGAIAGLDGVAMSSVDPDVALDLEVELMPGAEPAGERFRGSVREAASLFPNSVNVAAAAALAGPGLDATRIRVSHPGKVARNRLALTAESRFGTVRAEVLPRVGPGIHPVAASIAAALQQQLRPIWVG